MSDAATEATKPSALFTLRSPEKGVLELVITDGRRVKVYGVSLSQIKLLNFQAAQFIVDNDKS